jgi:hypothetical protein
MAVTSEPSPETHQLCAELRQVLSRHGVELPALMPLAELNISPSTEPDDTPVIWLGCCRAPTARRLLEVLRQVPPPRDLRAAVREANALSERNRLIKETLR